MKLVPRSKTAALLVELGVVYASLQVMLPFSLAVFPQEVQFNAATLEPHLSHTRATFEQQQHVSLTRATLEPHLSHTTLHADDAEYLKVFAI